MHLVDSIVAQVLGLDIALRHAHARLNAGTDREALHDLRINLRRLRSLLRPLREFEEVLPLDRGAAELCKMTSPVRDLEVLIAELSRQRATEQASAREAVVQSSYVAIVESSTVSQLFELLDQWPSDFRMAERCGELSSIRKTITKCLQKQVERLRTALEDPQHDRHRIRLLAKRLRYSTDAYPRLSPISPAVFDSLKRAQAALGDWHDHYQWSLKVSQEADLLHLQNDWQIAAAAALENSDVELDRLKALLREGSSPGIL